MLGCCSSGPLPKNELRCADRSVRARGLRHLGCEGLVDPGSDQVGGTVPPSSGDYRAGGALREVRPEAVQLAICAVASREPRGYLPRL